MDAVTSPVPSLGYVWDLDAPLLRLSPSDVWTPRAAFEGTLITGQIGSGKTSGSGAHLAKAYLRAGWGGLVLCAKQDERATWERYCAETGRSDSLIVFDGSGARRFNFLSYEMGRHRPGQAVTQNAIDLLMHVLDAVRGNIGTTGDDFWRDAMLELLANTIEPVWSAYGELRLSDLLDFVLTGPRSLEESTRRPPPATEWFKVMLKAANAPEHPLEDEDYRSIHDYWTRVFANPDQRTTGNIIATLSSKLSPLRRGLPRQIFCSDTNILPELSHAGGVIVMDFPIRVWGEFGVLAQHIFKYVWQKAAETRFKGPDTRPVFLWADEAQSFISPYDAEFQSTDRSSRVATTYLTQNLPNLYNKVGGRNPHDTVDALLGNFGTKIFHANSDVRTNSWGADTIGKAVQQRRNMGANIGSSVAGGRTRGKSTSSTDGKITHSDQIGDTHTETESHGTSWGVSEVVDYKLQPAEFATLRKGGPENHGIVDAILFQAGRTFRHSRSTWLPVEFHQE